MPPSAYWTIILRSACAEMFTRYREKIKLGLALGIMALIIQYALDVRGFSDSSKIAISLVASAALVMAWSFIKGLITTPASMHAQQLGAIDALQAEVTTKDLEVIRLRELSMRKHPLDEKREAEIALALQSLSPAEVGVIAWLLDAGETPRGRIQQRGLNVDTLYSRPDFPPLFNCRSHRPGNGIQELDRFYSINEEMKSALRSVIYPSHPL